MNLSRYKFIRPLVAAFLPIPVVAMASHEFDAGLENRMGLTFSPDGQTAYWSEWNGRWGKDGDAVRAIYTSQLVDGRWSKPQVAPFSQEFSNDEPFVSPDGRWVYFTSTRPACAEDKTSDADIWRYSLTGEPRLERVSISSPAEEYSPIVTNSGAIYFASVRDYGPGSGDLYRAPAAGDEFAQAAPLGSAINSTTGEWNLWVSPDESELIFEASERSTNVSIPGDLYFSWQTSSGWSAALPIDALNSRGSDLMPRLAADGGRLFYTTASFGGASRVESVNWHELSAALRESYAPTLVVANRSSHDLTFVDLATGDGIANVATGKGPHLLSNISNGQLVATGYGEYPRPHDNPVDKRPPFVESLNSLATVVDVESQTVKKQFVIEGCAKPHASWVIENRLYATCEDERHLAVVELASGTVVERIDTLQQGSHVIAHDAKTGTLAVTNTGSGSVTLVDVASSETTVVPLRGGSEGMLEVAGKFWIANGGEGSVSIVDPASKEVILTTERLCAFPIAVGANDGELVWLACFASGELVGLDSTMYTEQQRFKLPDNPLNLLLHPGRPLAYVSYPRKNAIAEIDLSSGEEIRRIRVGIEPDGLRWAAANH